MTDGEPAILLVVHDTDARHALQRFLERLGKITVVSELTAARQQLERACPEYMVLEQALPDGDGTSLIVEVRKRLPWAQCMVLVERQRASETARLIAAGASDVLVKPFDVGMLEPRMRRLMEALPNSRNEFVERQKLEQHLSHTDRIATLGTLLATVAHEIANPLQAIATNAALLRQELERAPRSAQWAPDALDVSVEEIQTATRMLTSFAERIRGFARRNGEAPVRASLEPIIATSLFFLKGRLAAGGITISGPSLNDPAPVVLHFSTRLTQAVTNALTNAVDAVGPGGAIQIGYEDSDGEVAIVITDGGPPVSEEVRARMFEPFYSTKERGSGLGMSIIRKVMAEHGGRVEIEAGPEGKGLCLRLILPRDAPV